MSATWQIINTYPPPLLTSNNADIYLANLDEINVDVSVLNTEEKIRASKMHFPQHQQRTQNARAILRHLIAHYAKIAAVDIEFKTTEYGKLYLEDHELQFNLAHSHEYAVYAFTRKHLIGVDIEEERDVEFDGIAQRIMSPTEYAYWSICPTAQQSKLFFEIWTRKEALIKTTGDGLSGPLKKINTITDTGNINSTVDYARREKLFLIDLPPLEAIVKNKSRPLHAALASDSALTINCYSLLPQVEFF